MHAKSSEIGYKHVSTSHLHLMSTWPENGHFPGGNKICYIGSKIAKCHDLAVWTQPKFRIKSHDKFVDFL